MVKANEFRTDYPGVAVKNLFPLVAEERMQKDEDEIELTKKAIALTKDGLCNVMANLKPGMKEYQAQADFEYIIRRGGAELSLIHISMSHLAELYCLICS